MHRPRPLVLVFSGCAALILGGEAHARVYHDAESYYADGSINLVEGDTERAIADLTKALELNPRHVEAYYKRGLAFSLTERWQDAVKDFTAALALARAGADSTGPLRNSTNVGSESASCAFSLRRQ